tara:strand:- start:11703 stop:12200 length:498 start_codon:yes stop_codon:yes gene_type:complete
MSEYRVRATGEVKFQGQVRLDNKNMSLPKVWTANVCDALGVDPVLAAPAPEPSAAYKSVVRNGVVQDGKGNWVYAWVEREMFTEYTDDNGDVQTVAAQKTAYDTANTAVRAAAERAKRTALLMETDHYALADVTMTDAMKTYRQALRDVPQQTDFPGTISWPTKP